MFLRKNDSRTKSPKCILKLTKPRSVRSFRGMAASILLSLNWRMNGMTLYGRIKMFFKITHRDIPSYSTLSYLFNKTSTEKPNPTLLATLRKTLNLKGNFHKLTIAWWTFVPVLYRLQQWHRANGTKPFKVFPILKNKRHHVTYDGQAFQQFLRN